MSFICHLYKKVEDFWFTFPEKIRYLLVGGFNTFFAYGVYLFFLQICHLSYNISLFLQNFISINVSILTMRYFVFQSHGKFWAEFFKAWQVYILMLLLNCVSLNVLVQLLHLHPALAQGLYIFFGTILSFILHKYYSFKKKNADKFSKK